MRGVLPPRNEVRPRDTIVRMAERLSFWQGAFSFGGPEWADRKAINANAEELELVEGNLTSLRTALQRQTQELLYMRAMFTGLIETLHARQPFAEGELEAAVQRAWTELTTPPPPPPPTPQGGLPKPKAPEHTVTCTKCLRNVPASQTTITANGEICDACS
jgi:hypothetical protein